MAYRILLSGQAFDHTSNTNFRNYLQQITDALTGGGMIQTADTGQINLTTVLTPTSGSQNRGYQIWRFADALQTTVPVFLKLEYGTATSGNTPAIWLTVGKGSDGNGNISGIIYARKVLESQTNAAAKHLLSVDTNRFSIILNYTDATSWIFFTIERSRDSSGTVTGDGLLVVANQGSFGTSQFAFAPYSGAIPTGEATGNCLLPSSGVTVSGANVGVFPPVFFWFGNNVNTNTNWFGYNNADILAESVVSVDVYGVPTDYLCLGNSAATQLFAVSRNTNRQMVRY